MKTQTILCLIALVLLVSPLFGQNTSFTYQGLLFQGGTPADGSYELSFALFDAPTNGNPVGVPITLGPVQISNGFFTVALDFGAQAFSGSDRWLEAAAVVFGSDQPVVPMVPRQQVTPVPEALRAASAAGLMSYGGEPLELNVGGQRAFRLQAGSNGVSSVVGGSAANLVLDGVAGAVIAGGTGNTNGFDYGVIGGGELNLAQGYAATVAGGRSNRSTAWDATVGGGGRNSSMAEAATVGGGQNNTVDHEAGTISGGAGNVVSGDYATVGGGTGNRGSSSIATVGGGSDNESGLAATIGGGKRNSASTNYATIGGGGYNVASGFASTVAGGGGFVAEAEGNRASGDWSAVGGGRDNRADGLFATVSGGEGNLATGQYAVAAGGLANQALGDFSFAAGENSHAAHEGAFVWADASFTGILSSSTNNQFTVRAAGGVRLFTDPEATVGTELAPGSGTWAVLSDRNAKEHVTLVDPHQILEKVAALPISTWNYKTQDPSIRHLGPMAQDFHTAFGLGENDRSIPTVDADGVALASIQALLQIVRGQAERLEANEREIAELKRALAGQAPNTEFAEHPRLSASPFIPEESGVVELRVKF